MMTAAEATSARGSLLGAVLTLLLYGVLPLSLLMYILGTPGRKRRRKAAETVADRKAAAGSSLTPDGGSQAPGTAVAAEGKET
jgi:hypothetical protein